jgi:hypothetical protein
VKIGVWRAISAPVEQSGQYSFKRQ